MTEQSRGLLTMNGDDTSGAFSGALCELVRVEVMPRCEVANQLRRLLRMDGNTAVGIPT